MPRQARLIDRDLFHQFLWKYAGRNKVFTIPQGEVAKRLNISYQQVSNIYKELAAAGRIKKNGYRWLIRDPADFS